MRTGIIVKTSVRQRLGLAAVVTALLLAEGCRSQMDVMTVQSSLPKPGTDLPPVPENLPNDVQVLSQKIYFQSRDTVTIAIDKAVIGGAATFSLLNVTNSKGNDANAIPVLTEAVPTSLGLADTGTYSLDEIDGDKLQISFYPGQDNWTGKFLYGPNTLKVVAVDNVESRYSTVTFTLQDFQVFGPAASAFSDNVQVEVESGSSGYQYQGWVNVLSSPVVADTTSGAQLVSGAFRMVNPY